MIGARSVNCRRWITLAPAAALSVVPLSGAAAAAGCITPPNETCAGAITFDGDDLPFFFSGPLGCVNDIPDRPYFDTFFRVDVTCTGNYTFDMCDSAGDTYIRIYSAGCGFVPGDELAVGDDECPGSPPNADPLITVALEAGASYWIEAGTWRPDPPWAPPPNSLYMLTVSACTTDCPADLDGDGSVGFNDLNAMLQAWGPCPGCPADFDGNGAIGFSDLNDLLTMWGPCA